MSAHAEQQLALDLEDVAPFRRFAESRPARPYCTNDLQFGLKQRARDVAIRCRYVQVGSSRGQGYLTFDVDHEDGARMWRAVGLPRPTFVIENSANGHAHIIFELERAVSLATVTPAMRLYAMVERVVGTRLKADPNFVGLIAKNPLHGAWWTDVIDRRYTLTGLLERFSPDELAYRPKRSRGVGRNVDLFDWLRFTAYERVRDLPDQDALATFLGREGATLNRDGFETPLSDAEVRSVVKSVAKWTWAHRERFASGRRQVRRGAMGFTELPSVMLAADRLAIIAERRSKTVKMTHEARRASTRARIQSALLDIIAEGGRVSGAAIARRTGIARRTVYEHRDLLAGDGRVIVLLPGSRAAGVPKVSNMVQSDITGSARPASEGEDHETHGRARKLRTVSDVS